MAEGKDHLTLIEAARAIAESFDVSNPDLHALTWRRRGIIKAFPPAPGAYRVDWELAALCLGRG